MCIYQNIIYIAISLYGDGRIFIILEKMKTPKSTKPSAAVSNGPSVLKTPASAKHSEPKPTMIPSDQLLLKCTTNGSKISSVPGTGAHKQANIQSDLPRRVGFITVDTTHKNACENNSKQSPKKLASPKKSVKLSPITIPKQGSDLINGTRKSHAGKHGLLNGGGDSASPSKRSRKESSNCETDTVLNKKVRICGIYSHKL